MYSDWLYLLAWQYLHHLSSIPPPVLVVQGAAELPFMYILQRLIFGEGQPYPVGGGGNGCTVYDARFVQ